MFWVIGAMDFVVLAFRRPSQQRNLFLLYNIFHMSNEVG
jgi:hypothetical protein